MPTRYAALGPCHVYRDGEMTDAQFELDALYDHSVIGLALIDRDERFQRVNARLADLFGVKHDYLINQRTADVLPKAAAPLASAISAALRAGDTVERVDIEFESAGDKMQRRHLSGRVHPVRDAAGKIVAAGAMVEEVTQQREAQERNAHFAAVIESSGDPIVSFSPDGIIRSWNPAAERLYGYGAHEAVGRHVTDVYMAHAREEAEKLIVRALQGETFTIETSRMSRHSDEIAVSVTIAPIRSADGKITGLSAITRDIRDRKRAEAALAQSMAQLNSLLTNAPIGFAFFNREHKFVRVNEYFSRLDGLPVEAHLDSKIEDVLPRNAAIFTPLLDQVFDTRRAITDVELSAESPGEPGSERQWLIGIYPVMNAQEQCEFAGAVVLDITERKQREDHIHYLLRELTHRSKNIMAIVQAMARQTVAEALSARDFEEKFSARLQGFAHSHDLLLKENWQGVAIDELVKSQLGAFAELIGSRIEIKGPNLLLTPEATQNLGLALHELSINAAKHGALSTPEGAVLVHWSTFATDEGEPQFLLSWSEMNGPEVKPPRHRGFGQLVLERMLPRALEGDVRLDFAEAGLKWSVTMPGRYIREVQGR
ncbi:MAG: PAS domain-containing protein [Beijerinckiaceae bacterium]